MTEAEKKKLYDESYAKWLKFHKNEFSQYDKHLKIPLKARWEILEHVKSIFDIMKKCNVNITYSDGEDSPMSNVYEIMLRFKDEGDPNTLDDMLISSKESCWSTVLFEQTEQEIEDAAKRSAEMDVDMAEWKEKKEAEEAEKRRKEEEEWKARNQAEEEHRARCKKEMDDWQTKDKAHRKSISKWFNEVVAKLDEIRKDEMHWYADDYLNGIELNAVENYVSTLFAFTHAQNMGMTGIGLYAQNEARAQAHETLLEVFGLANNEYALHATKSYDYSDDYDYKTQTYKHLPEDKVINMLGYALVEARKMKD